MNKDVNSVSNLVSTLKLSINYERNAYFLQGPCPPSSFAIFFLPITLYFSKFPIPYFS